MKREIDTGEKMYNINRRTFVKLAGTTAAALAFGGIGLPRLVLPVDAVPNPTRYVDALPIPPVAKPVINVAYPGADYYEMSIKKNTSHRFHSQLPATDTYSYATKDVPADYLGPTIIAQKGKKVVIKFTNNLPIGQHLFHDAIDTTITGSLDGPNADGSPWPDENRVCVHLHGGKVRPEFDGGPRDWFSPVGSKQTNPYPEAATFGLKDSHVYKYPNDQPATLLWYHDHAWGITRFNPFAGLAAAYILRDNIEKFLIRIDALPSGKYEVPIVLQDRLLDLDTGAMIYPKTDIPGSVHPIWIPEYFGDTSVVNGKLYPYLDVEPKRYRFRFLNGSNARFYNVSFDVGLGPIPFYVIGSEQGFLPIPVRKTKLLIAPGERFDTIVDFSGLAKGTNLLLKNDAKAPYPDGDVVIIDDLMQFRVKQTTIVTATKDRTTPAKELILPSIASIIEPNKPWREIVLEENSDPETGEPQEVLLDGRNFIESINQDLFVEAAGSIAVWQFINTTGDAHPMHTHLVPFLVLNRQQFDVTGFTNVWDAWIAGNRAGPRPSVDQFLIGNPRNPDPEETGLKDTAKSYPGEVLRIVTKFDLPSDVPAGTYRYVCHCHILEHEENDMMFQFAVVKSE